MANYDKFCKEEVFENDRCKTSDQVLTYEDIIFKKGIMLGYKCTFEDGYFHKTEHGFYCKI
jgi:hypothetical protein